MKVKTNKLAAQYAAQSGTNPAILEAWSPVIQKITNVSDPSKLEWMSQLAHNTAKLNEDAFQNGANAYSAMGATYQPYNTLYNTLGVGDVKPSGVATMTGADQADPRNLGSGDKLPALLPLALKVAAKTIGFELVNTTPLQGPSGVLPYMDYVYTGSKEPYGATPSYNAATRNPMANSQTNAPYEVYGLPHAFKASIKGNEDATPAAIKRSLKGATAIPAGTMLTSAASGWNDLDASHPHAGVDGSLIVEFIGWSRVDGDPMFKVINGTQSLGAYFNGEGLSFTGTYTPVGAAEAIDLELTLVAPRLISMLEDQIQGFAGAGERDRDAWYGTYQDGTVLYEPMSRGVGEQTPARQISLKLFTKNVQVGTIEVGCAVTQEQVQDLQKQWGIDVVKMVENAAVNELSQTINRHITSRLFALGWKNHYKMVEVEGPAANLNLSLDATYTPSSEVRMTPAYAIPQNAMTDETGVEYANQVNVALPFKPLYLPASASFENRDTLIKRLMSNFLLASNWILQRGRYGAATFAVTNITVATLLQTNANYQFSPLANTITQNGGSLYPIGTIAGMTVYVDPLMSGSDCRVLVGRKGAKDEPGVHFCPYILAETFRTIAEATMAPKLMVKSRYALVDAGFFPETQYVTFVVDAAGL
jgi:hypothetical protein